MGSTLMRAIVPTLILSQTRPQLHGARVTFFASLNSNTSVSRFQQHIATHGRPFACVLAKYDYPELRGACQSLGALALLDCIDNHRCFSLSGNRTSRLRESDSVLVQIRAHASLSAKQHVSANVRASSASSSTCAPASHRNVEPWSLPSATLGHSRICDI
jgi:hypothetical protein